nr:hypothetical protein [Mycolicibacterium sphagni]
MDDEGDDRASQREVAGDEPIAERQVRCDGCGAASGEVSCGCEHRQTDADLDESDASGVEAPPPGKVCHHDNVAGARDSGEQHQQVAEAGRVVSTALGEQSDPEHRHHRRCVERRGKSGALDPLRKQRSHDDRQGDDQSRVGCRGHGESERLQGEDRAEEHPEDRAQGHFGAVYLVQSRDEHDRQPDRSEGEPGGEKTEHAVGCGDILGCQIAGAPDDGDDDQRHVDSAVGGHEAIVSTHEPLDKQYISNILSRVATWM